MPLAHSENAGGDTHDLREHLDEVARIAADFAAPFGSAAWGRAAGLWHDLGKNAADFQARLKAGKDAHKDDDADENKSVPGRVEHAIAGAIHAVNRWGLETAGPITPIIAGHHAGLPDSGKHATDLDSPQKRARLAAAERGPGAVILDASPPEYPVLLTSTEGLSTNPPDADKDWDRRLEFWMRMLFSCLVDADWLDTAKHFAGGDPDAELKESIRGGTVASAGLLVKLDAHMVGLTQTTATPEVNRVRAQVLADCRERGRECAPGVFTLTAPTGSGKTLAGMAFALEHAVKHDSKRVIVVLPFTSIIDQNAKVYRDVFGAGNVVDHHASLDPKRETDRNRAACENWDAPVVVTTSVQFLESLLANRPARCRKLHNVCESVVIFDEVQTLPVGHLNPVLDVLKELVRAYRVSLVLSTATQPALGYREPRGLAGAFQGFTGTTEIVRDVPGAFENLARVRVEWPSSSPPPAGKMTDDERHALWVTLADEVGRFDRVLVITHARRDCRELAELVPDAVHLSALMCPKHRLKVLDEIRAKLLVRGSHVRVVATQLVEAGVDVDFPVVYRAAAGFDSLAQAAGRCNRNGQLGPLGGRLVVFHAPGNPPPGMPQLGKQAAESMRAADPKLDPFDPAVFGPYFTRLYETAGSLDVANIQSDRAARNFKTVAENFRVVDPDGSSPVVVPYDAEATRAVEALRRWGPSRDRLRALQPYAVSVHECQVRALVDAGAVELVADTMHAVGPLHRKLYSERFGLELSGPVAADAELLTMG